MIGGLSVILGGYAVYFAKVMSSVIIVSRKYLQSMFVFSWQDPISWALLTNLAIHSNAH